MAKFEGHEGSKCHKESVFKIVTMPSTMGNVAASLSKQRLKVSPNYQGREKYHKGLRQVMQVLNFMQLWSNTIDRCTMKHWISLSLLFEKGLISLDIGYIQS